MYTKGDIIKNINPDSNAGEKSHSGDSAVVTLVESGYVHVRYENGDTGKSNNPTRYYKVISGACYSEPCESINSMQSITTFFKNLTLSSDDRLLRKYNLMNECGEFTSEAKALVQAKQVEENKAFLVEVATKFEAEIKAENE